MIVRVDKIMHVSPDIWELSFVGSFPYEQVNAGQFVNIRIGTGYDHILRRPISIAAVDQENKRLTLVFRVVGDGTKWLSGRRVGDDLDILGPLGTGFPIVQGKSILIVGGGIGIPPLYQLASELNEKSNNIQMVLGFRHQADCFWLDRFNQLGEVTITTEDGSLGQAGYVTDTLGKMKATGKVWQYLYSCGPMAMLRAIREQFRGTSTQGYVSLEEKMACGVGACYGCVCSSENQQSAKRICIDGPVFPWQEVAL